MLIAVETGQGIGYSSQHHFQLFYNVNVAQSFRCCVLAKIGIWHKARDSKRPSKHLSLSLSLSL